MADDKSKPKPKPAPAAKKVDIEDETIDLIVLLLFFGVVGSALIPVILKFLLGISFSDTFGAFFSIIYKYYKFAATLISALLATGIVYCTIRLNQIRTEEEKLYSVKPDSTASETPDAEIKKHRNQKWVHVEQLIDSTNPSDWRLAIIEADILLDEMLSRMPYPGETIADKLKTVEKSDFNTIENAWEAHKARNQVVHAGSDYQLTEREAKRIIDLYRSVFEEFFFV